MILAPVCEIASTMEELILTSRLFYEKNWSLATSSNYSARLSTGEILITASGRQKNLLKTTDFLTVDLEGNPTQKEESLKPSAETLLHCQIYRRFSKSRAVLHTHSVFGTLLSQEFLPQGYLEIKQYEMLKALDGIHSHETTLRIPIFPNSQDMVYLSKEVEKFMQANPNIKAYLIAGHGLYSWASSVAACRRQVEALEFLLQCQFYHLFGLTV